MSRWRAIRRLFTLKCEESTQLVSKSLDADLTCGERLAVRLHALICRSCRRFARQVHFLRTVVATAVIEETSWPPAPSALSNDARLRLAITLRESQASPES